VLASTPISNTELLPQNIGGELGLPQGDIRVTIARIIRVAMGLIGIVMVAAIIYGGFLYMTAGGNEDQAGTGKKAITAGVIGLAIVLSAWALTNFIIDQLVAATAGTGTP
jgi:TRAP-type C4-dicarboxylate transport system permease small subunit